MNLLMIGVKSSKYLRLNSLVKINPTNKNIQNPKISSNNLNSGKIIFTITIYATNAEIILPHNTLPSSLNGNNSLNEQFRILEIANKKIAILPILTIIATLDTK